MDQIALRESRISRTYEKCQIMLYKYFIKYILASIRAHKLTVFVLAFSSEGRRCVYYIWRYDGRRDGTLHAFMSTEWIWLRKWETDIVAVDAMPRVWKYIQNEFIQPVFVDIFLFFVGIRFYSIFYRPTSIWLKASTTAINRIYRKVFATQLCFHLFSFIFFFFFVLFCFDCTKSKITHNIDDTTYIVHTMSCVYFIIACIRIQTEKPNECRFTWKQKN